MKFTKEFLVRVIDEDFYDEEGIKVISDKIVGNSRWSLQRELVFKYQDKFYKTIYSVGATESQYEGPFEWNDDDDIIEEVYEVHPVEKTVIVYE